MNQLWILGFIVNIVLLYSVFDIYFKSPIVKVYKTDTGTVDSGIKRVVFFVGDGLRADTYFNHPTKRPRLTEIMNSEHSVWGISDTRVPTESRPGHIALFAGFYEDPSAVFTGWQDNLVDFDSIFNRTRFTVALGSPDIIPMFAKGAAKLKLSSETYAPEKQDFMVHASSFLDDWVLETFEKFVENRKLPDEDQSLIFLHMLGIDNTGHASKPQSNDYVDAMTRVDGIVAKVETAIQSYYGDNQTLFIFTSDHGMTDWGSHGSGSKEETETPFVIWGPGIKTTNNARLNQADFAALLGGALNIAYPTNSIGRFPSAFWTDLEFAYDATITNYYQIYQLMQTKKEMVYADRNFVLFTFMDELEMEEEEMKSQAFAKDNNYVRAIRHINLAIDLALEGNKYYERYDQYLLIAFTVVSFFAWIAIVGCSAIKLHSAEPNERSELNVFSSQLLWAIPIAVVISKCAIGWSVWRLPYVFLPIYLSSILVTIWRSGISSEYNLKSLLILIVLCGIGVEILVNSFYERAVLTLGLILNAIWSLKGKKVSTWQCIYFLTSVAFLGLFPIVPVIGKDQNPWLMTIGPVVSCSLVVSFIRKCKPLSMRDALILIFQAILLLSVSVLIHFPSFVVTRFVSWLSVIISFSFPCLISSNSLMLRIFSIFIGIATPFSFLSISHEGLFLPALFLTLLFLVKIEMSEANLDDTWEEFLVLTVENKERTKMWGKVDIHTACRRAWLHLFFVFLSFFGTGNIGSVSSFDPSAVRCFVTVFSPWIMMVALLEKIIGPFLLVSCFFRRLLWSRQQVQTNFLIVLLLCQGMAFHMFFKVTNRGSWLEIGTSISHYVIVQCTTLFLFVLHFCANFLISVDLFLPPSTFQFPAKTSKLQ